MFLLLLLSRVFIILHRLLKHTFLCPRDLSTENPFHARHKEKLFCCASDSTRPSAIGSLVVFSERSPERFPQSTDNSQRL